MASVQFAQRGFGAATILEIAAACRISRAGLLHHFADKEALLSAVLQDRDTEDRARFRPYAPIPAGMGILVGMVELAEHNRLVPGLIELFVRLSSEASATGHPAHEYFLRRYHRIREGTTVALRMAQNSGYLRSEVDPEDAGTRLTALMDGLQVQWLIDNSLDMAYHVHQAIRGLLTETGAQAFDNARAAIRPRMP
jgi:AcrR family transcriptional regulator